MVRYAFRALPWPLLSTIATVVFVLMEVVRRWPWTMWPLEGCAVGLVAAGAAWCCDEPAAAMVDNAPRSLWWRTTARLLGVCALLGVWVLSVALARDSLFEHPVEVALQGVIASAAVVAWATWRRSRGAGTPGGLLAAGIVPVVTFWAVARPLPRSLPLFPYTTSVELGGDWASSLVIWLVVAAVAAALLIAAVVTG
jgi:hypothetical protein